MKINTREKTTNLYRRGVGIMVINHNKNVFVGQRINKFVTTKNWQMPQGGIDLGEDIITAAKRELAEETSITSIELLSITPKWLKYNIPLEIANNLYLGKYIGQKQKWLLMRFTGIDSEININTLNPEFCAWRWESIYNLESIIIEFKRALYHKVVNYFEPILSKL